MLAVARPEAVDVSVGLACQPWGASWLASQGQLQRSYHDDVVLKLQPLDSYTIKQYGSLSYDRDRYPLLAAVSADWDKSLPAALVTAGIHGKDTAAVAAALTFLQTKASDYAGKINFVVVPCASPWSYETMKRWNPNEVDPNHSFRKHGPAEESRKLAAFVQEMAVAEWSCHIDLHDEFGLGSLPAGASEAKCGLRLIADAQRSDARWARAVLNEPAGEGPVPGLTAHHAKEFGLCLGMTSANYVAATEVSPDLAATPLANQVLAQVNAVTAALDFVLEQYAQ